MRSLIPGISLMVIQLALGTACAGTTAQMSQDTPQGPVEVSLSTTQKSTRLTLGDSRYKIHLIEITDSRCPANAKCIWQGELAAELEVERESSGTKDSKRFTLGQETMPALKTLGASFELLKITETTLEFRVAPEPATP